MNTLYKKIFIIVGTIFVVVILFIFIVTYIFRVESPAIGFVRNAMHLPAMIVDGKWISLTEIEENTDSIRQFYENQDFSQYGIRIDFATDNGQKRLQLQERKMLNKLIEDTMIEEIAQEWNIALSDEAVRDAMERPMSEMNTRESVQSRLDNLYGWSLEDFGDKVVRGQLLREKVATKFEEQNAVTEDMREKIIQAKKELDDGRTFSDVAMKYSEGSTAQEGGIMGWFSDTQLQDEIGKDIGQMEAGNYSDVIETPLGLHIVRVNEVSEDDTQKLIHVSQIIIKKNTFADFLNDRIVQMNVKVFVPQYTWNQEKGLLVFADDRMNDFEKQMQEEAQEIQRDALNK